MPIETLAQFPATLHRISSDHDGEATVVLKIPLSAIAEVTKLYLGLGKLLGVTVTTPL